jgi:hypothetical protein
MSHHSTDSSELLEERQEDHKDELRYTVTLADGQVGVRSRPGQLTGYKDVLKFYVHIFGASNHFQHCPGLVQLPAVSY